MMTSRHNRLILAALACPASIQISGFVPYQKDVLVIRHAPCHHLPLRPTKLRRTLLHSKHEASDEVVQGSNNASSVCGKLLSAQRLMGALSAVAWILISVTALSYHPDPKFADCTLRHNVLTMSQAFAFQLPVGYATISALSSSALTINNSVSVKRRLNLAVAVASMWLASSAAFASKFAFGYDLYTLKLKAFASAVHVTNGLLALFAWKKSFDGNKMSISSCASRVIRGIIGSLWNIGPSHAVTLTVLC